MKKTISILLAMTLLIISLGVSLAEGLEGLFSDISSIAESTAPVEDTENAGDTTFSFDTSGLFGGIIADIQEDEAEKQKTEKQKPLEGSLFPELGQCTLYEHNYAFNGRNYEVYLFEKSNINTINNLVTMNKDKFYFEVNTISDTGHDLYILKQFGDDGKYAIISENVSGHTLVMLEEDMPVEGYHFPQFCNTCAGKGTCSSCAGIPTCTRCNGHGRDNCVRCNGTGECPFCDGQGGRESVSTYNPWSDCSLCDWGTCRTCDGWGYNKDLKYNLCSRCNGTGKCVVCVGSGKCSSCGGDGII